MPVRGHVSVPDLSSGVPLLTLALVATALLLGQLAAASPAHAVTEISDTVSVLKSSDSVSNSDLALLLVDETPITQGDTIVVARDDQFADALAAGVLQDGAPLILVPSDGVLPDPIADRIGDLAPTRAIVLGGQAAVSADMADQIQALGPTVERRAGASRFETAVQIAAGATPSSTIVLARAFPSTGAADPTQAFADSLAAGGMAARNGWPILLTQSDALTTVTRDYMVDAGVTTVRIVGGTAAISAEVEAEVRTIATTVERIAGDSRAGTAVEIAKAGGADSAADAARVIVVDSQGANSWVGGFAAATHAAAFDAPIVLAAGDELPPETASFLSSGVGGDPAAAPVLTCVVDPSTCGQTREVAGLPGAIDLRVTPSGGVLSEGQAITLTGDGPGRQIVVAGSCLQDQSQVVTSGGTITAAATLPDGPCTLTAQVVLAAGITQTVRITYNEQMASGDLEPLRVVIDQVGQVERIEIDARAGEQISLGHTGSDGGCPEVRVLAPGGGQLSGIAPFTCGTDATFAGPGLPTNGWEGTAPITLTRDGLYTIEAGIADDGAGTYDLYINRPTIRTVEPGDVAVPTRVDRPGDFTVLRFDGRQDQQITFGFGSGGDCTVLTLRGPNGTVLEEFMDGPDFACNDPSGASSLITLPQGGTYSLTSRFFAGDRGLVEVYLNTPTVVADALDRGLVPVGISRPGQVTTASFIAEAGQQIGLGITGATGTCAMVQVVDPAGDVLNFVENGSSSCRPDAQQLRQPLVLPAAGVYTVVAGALDGTRGGYSMAITTARTVRASVEGPGTDVAVVVPGQFTLVEFEGQQGQELSYGYTGVGCVAVSVESPTGQGAPGGIGHLDGCDQQGRTTVAPQDLSDTGTYTAVAGAEDGTLASFTFFINEVVRRPVAIGSSATTVTLDRPGRVTILEFDTTDGQAFTYGFTSGDGLCLFVNLQSESGGFVDRLDEPCGTPTAMSGPITAIGRPLAILVLDSDGRTGAPAITLDRA